MLMPSRSYTAGSQFRYGFNGKDRDKELLSTTEYDYGFRIYSPAFGRFLSVDPLSQKYAWYTPYQFAGNKPIKFVDVDGLEDGLEVRTRRMEEGYLKGTVTHSELRTFYNAQAFGAAMGIGIVLTRGAILRYTPQLYYFAVTSGVWMTNPSNVQILQNTAGFVFSILNPDPNNTGVDFPGEGDEIGRTLNLTLRTKLGKLVQFFAEKGSKFANKSEWKWAQKLLDEGNNVRLIKESTEEGAKSADFFVNNVKTEVKEISNMVSDKLSNRIMETMQGAIKQAGSGGNIIIDVSQQQGATRELMQNIVERLKGSAKDISNYRIVGKDFELTGSIAPPKKS